MEHFGFDFFAPERLFFTGRTSTRPETDPKPIRNRPEVRTTARILPTAQISEWTRLSVAQLGSGEAADLLSDIIDAEPFKKGGSFISQPHESAMKETRIHDRIS